MVGGGREESARGGKGCKVMGRGGGGNARAAKLWRGIRRKGIGKEGQGRRRGRGRGRGRGQEGSERVS